MFRTAKPVLMVLSAALMALAGCAVVTPGPDYQRAGQYVTQATGQRSIYQPGDDEAIIADKVKDLLAGGITADEAVQICLLNNPGLQAAFMDVGMARADVVQSGLLSNPSLGMALGFPAGGGLANIDAGLAQDIAELWQIPARKRATERSLDRAILRLARQAADLAADTKIAYYKAVGTEQLHGIRQEDVTVAQNLLDLALVRQTTGAATDLDVNLSRRLALDAELEAESGRLARADARRALARLLGLTTDASKLVLVDVLPEVPPKLPDAEKLIELACVYCLDMQAARQAVAAAKARLQEECRRVFRNVELGVSLERGERQRQGGRDILADTARASIANGGLTAPGIQPRSERGQGTDFIIGPSLSLELPIFDQNQAQIAKATYAYEQAVKNAEALRRAAAQEVRSSVDRVLTAWKLAQIYRDRSLPLARENLDLSREAYRAGRASFLAVLEAQRLFLESRSRAAETAQTAATAAAEMERTMCLPFDELVAKVGAETETNTQVDRPKQGGKP